MYMFRTSPKTLDRNVDAIRMTVALNAVCACDGRSTRTARASSEGAPARG
jgi:hypothetical protein